ncbi:L-alanine-DL-glutamate epimerase-like enolase superfamily enzyme [Azospirillum brasilense]|nr:L-alanine-DL-glutamate epimerase-like enolase superfamily enzyme [Azospirillum brasilense]
MDESCPLPDPPPLRRGGESTPSPASAGEGRGPRSGKGGGTAPLITIRAIDLYERPVRFVKPFRFGSVTVEAAPQAFVRALVHVDGVGEAWGGTAEMMMPKWFDKRPERSPDETVDGLRRSLRLARDAYGTDRADTAFGHHAVAYETQRAACRAAGLPDLTAAYGPALIDKAVLDGLLRVLGMDVFTGMRANLAGIDARLTPDLAGFDLDGFLAGLEPRPSVALRHTVGLLDEPEALRDLLARERLTRFKIKLGGDPVADLARLTEIAGVLDAAAGDYRATLDGNEQYAGAFALDAFVAGLERDPALAGFRGRLLYIEQPVARERALEAPLGAVAERIPFIIDESDDGYDAFPRARAAGYRGVSSKSCKGLYKAVLNRARCEAWGAPHFVAAEDLTCQAGLAVQQDTALVALLGIADAERNGHQYGNGFDGAPEADAFLDAHPGFYTRRDGTVRLATAGGSLPTETLAVPGFASAAQPRWDRLSPLQNE